MSERTILDAMNKVRQTRIYLDKPVAKDDLDTLLEIAQWTGSARNIQPWHFIVVENKESLAKLAALRARLEADPAVLYATALESGESAVGSGACLGHVPLAEVIERYGA